VNSGYSGAIINSPHFGQDGRPKYRSWKKRIGAATWSVMTNPSVLDGTCLPILCVILTMAASINRESRPVHFY